jgi:DNA repair protein RecO (recombination protein O)
MDWQDEGIVLATRPFGETGTIVMLMTPGRGRHAGLVRGQRIRQHLQPGTQVTANWRARLADHLGTMTVEPGNSAAAEVYDDPLRLAALASACALVHDVVPERAPYPNIYQGLASLIELLPGPVWDAAYVQWELELLRALGFGLDLTRCAATGRNDQLAFVSPRSGRAVTLSAAEPYRDRMLPLPGFLIGRGEADPQEVLTGLELTGHFVERWLFGQSHLSPSAARTRYVERYRRHATASSST